MDVAGAARAARISIQACSRRRTRRARRRRDRSRAPRLRVHHAQDVAVELRGHARRVVVGRFQPARSLTRSTPSMNRRPARGPGRRPGRRAGTRTGSRLPMVLPRNASSGDPRRGRPRPGPQEIADDAAASRAAGGGRRAQSSDVRTAASSTSRSVQQASGPPPPSRRAAMRILLPIPDPSSTSSRGRARADDLAGDRGQDRTPRCGSGSTRAGVVISLEERAPRGVVEVLAGKRWGCRGRRRGSRSCAAGRASCRGPSTLNDACGGRVASGANIVSAIST